MGVIQRQGLKNFSVQIVGGIVAFFATIYVYPIDFALYGLFGFLANTALLLAPIMSFGIGAVTVKFFPTFKDQSKGHNGFLFFLLVHGSLVFLISSLLLFIFKDQLLPVLGKLGFDIEMIRKYSGALWMIIYLNILSAIFYLWMSNFKRIAIPAVFDYLFPKIVVPLVFLAIFSEILEKDSFPQYFIYIKCAIVLGLIGYTASQNQLQLKPRFSKFKKNLVKKMFSYQGYAGLSSLGSKMTMRVDAIMVATLLGFGFNGIYLILQNITYMIYIPYRSLEKISGPIISNHFANNQVSKVKEIYKSSSSNMLFMGLLLFGCLWINVDDLFIIMKRSSELLPYKSIILLLGIAVIFDLGSGINNQIMLFSDLFKWNLWIVLGMGILNLILNYLLIKTFDMGIIGAAYATLLAIILFNIFKIFIISNKYKLQPFSESTVGLLLVASGLILFGALTSLPFNSYINILLKSIVFGSLFLVIIHRYGWANEATFAVLNNLKNLVSGKKIKL